MARRLHQHPSARTVYEIGVDSIEASRRNEVRESGQEKYGTTLLGRLLTDLTVAQHNRREQHYRERGESGEEAVVQAFLKALSSDWYLFTPYVIFPRPGDYAQLDHLLIGPPGLFIVETKAWQGSFKGKRDAWSRRIGNEWHPCDSPTHQLSRHLYWLRQWLSRHGVPGIRESWEELTGASVVFTAAKWVHAYACSFPVAATIEDAVSGFRDDTRRRLSTSQIVALVERMTAPPLPIFKSAERPPAPSPASPDIPLCPLCAVPMLKRTATKGKRAGQSFWGCPRYPNCRQILPFQG